MPDATTDTPAPVPVWHDQPLAGRVVVVTGVGPGLGRDTALACARAGADVVLAARTVERLDAIAGEITDLGRVALPVATDVTDLDQIDALVAAAVERFGRIDGLVNSAFRQPPFERLADTPLEEWYTSLEMNCTTALKMSRAVLPTMVAQGSGAIVNVATMSIRHNKPNLGAYSAAKSALTSITRTMAKEHGPEGIRVNAVCPGFIFGDSVRWFLDTQAQQKGTTYDDEYDAVASEIALRFIPDSEQIARPIVFLLSDGAAAITGASLDVNGGHVTTW